MSDNKSKTPFFDFGQTIKKLRVKANESTSDVAGAVELDTKTINEIEAGMYQPSEDIVLLLISHFGLKDNEASSIWKLAGYDQVLTGRITEQNHDNIKYEQMPHDDSPIVYTDIVQVNANRYGVVINFLQSYPGTMNSMAVAKVGMSHEHAKSMLSVLESTLNAINQEEKQKDQKKN
jgi:DNA-binding XRE family transcriptional regulator